jgi:hypothetical protein
MWLKLVHAGLDLALGFFSDSDMDWKFVSLSQSHAI